jgi:hypothetical protein
MISIPAASKIFAKEKSYAVIIEIFSPACFIFCNVLVVILFTSLLTDIKFFLKKRQAEMALH